MTTFSYLLLGLTCFGAIFGLVAIVARSDDTRGRP